MHVVFDYIDKDPFGSLCERRLTMKWIVNKCFICTTVLCLLISGCQIHMYNGSKATVRHTRTVELQTALAPGSHVELRTAAGSIQVQGADVDVCKVVATIKTRGKTQEEAVKTAEKVTIRFKQGKEGLQIKADTPRFSKGLGISYQVTVPRETSITCGAASGRIHLTGLTGTFSARTASGSVTCDQMSGESVRLRTASGSMRLSQASLEKCDLLGASGSITCTDIDCPEIEAKTASGSVTVTCTPSASKELVAHLSTGSGSVSLSVPQGFSGSMELSAGSGSVHTDIPISVKGKLKKKHLAGTVGEGNGNLRLKTASGSVRVR